MILGIGIDQVEITRMSGLLTRRPRRARSRLFTDEEQAYCDDRRDAAECYAARFAAKEAFMKALGTGWAKAVEWTEVEVVTEEDGRPRLRVSGTAEKRLREAGGRSLHLSFTHEAGVAAAVVVIEG